MILSFQTDVLIKKTNKKIISYIIHYDLNIFNVSYKTGFIISITLNLVKFNKFFYIFVYIKIFVTDFVSL